jgi:hypothetical protein
MNIQSFVAKSIMHLVEKGFTVRLINEKRVKISKGFYSSGYCCDVDKELVVAVGKDAELWFEIFVHEYCHFLQWEDKAYEDGEAYVWDSFDRWISGRKSLVPRTVNKYVDIIRECEMDCEKRVVALIKKHNLPMDVDQYIQKANVYGLFYSVVAKHRKWYSPGKEAPTEIDELIQMMPTTFLSSWDDIPPEFEKIVVARCFRK